MSVDTFPRFDLFGTSVAATQIPEVIETMDRKLQSPGGEPLWLVHGCLHVIMEAHRRETYRELLRAAVVVPDGKPVVVAGRLKGHDLPRRVYGPELLEAFLAATGDRYRHAFVGGKPGLAERLAELMRTRYGTRVVGCFSPPFRDLTDAEEAALTAAINATGADVLWVFLGSPKQEQWIARNSFRLEAPIRVGSGAAIDFLTGAKPQAPRFMRESGFEWLFRFATEPRRLWRRYVLDGARFLVAITGELATRGRSGDHNP